MTRTTKLDGSRTYSVPDEQGNFIDLPSVTTILRIVAKPALLYWAANSVANYAIDHHDEVAAILAKDDRDGAYRLLKGSPWSKRDRAANIGSIVHDLIDKLTLGQEVDVPVAAQPYIDAWSKFITEYGGEFGASEMTVYSLTHGYAGTLDALYRFGDRLGCIDYKSRQGKSFIEQRAYETELLQVAAYAHADSILLPSGQVEPMPKVDGGSIVLLCDDGYAISKIDMARDFEGFLAAKKLWDWRDAL